MKIIKRMIGAIVILIFGFSPFYGLQSDLKKGLYFGAMEIFKFNNGTSHLTIVDINLDGLEDILFLNNRASRLEILIRLPGSFADWEKGFPQLEERFVNKGIVLDQWTRTFQVADVNNDQRPDLISIGDQLGLVIYKQESDGSYTEPVSQYIKESNNIVSLILADLNDDTSKDILICRKNNAEMLLNKGNGSFKSHVAIPFSATGCLGAILADINGDKRLDLLLYFGSKKGSLRVRLGIGKGEFGWEQTLMLPALKSLVKLEVSEQEKSHLAVLLKNGIILRLYECLEKEQGHVLERAENSPHRLPLIGVSRKEPPTWLVSDFNHDGYSDFCVAAPLLSQIHLYMGSPMGLQPLPQRFDSLNAIKTIKRTANGDWVVFSAAEKAIAIHSAKNLAQFPQFFKAPGKPLAMDVGPPHFIFALYKEEGYQLQIFDSRKTGSSPIQTHELSIANAPQEMKIIPLNENDQWMIVLFMAYEPPVAYHLQGEKLSLFQPEDFRPLSLNLEAKTLTAIGLENESQVLISEGGVCRLYQWQDEKFQVKRQLNSGRKTAELSVACLFPDQNNKQGYLIFDEAGQDLIWFSSENKKNMVPLHFRERLQDIKGIAMLQFKDHNGLLMVGTTEVQWVHENQPTLSLKTLAEYSSRAEKPELWDIIPVTLGNPKREMLALLDSENRSIELVGIKDQELTEELIFEVFQAPGFRESASNYEPHSLGTGDINGDGIQDMAILVHDKVIIYIGE